MSNNLWKMWGSDKFVMLESSQLIEEICVITRMKPK